jgi:hypothetical protein
LAGEVKTIMSMDLEVWSEVPFDLPAWLPAQEEWKQHGEGWSFDGGGWQILVVLDAPETVPDAVGVRLSRAAHVAYVTLEPIGADREGYILLERVVRTLARQSNGVWVDPYCQPFGADEGTFGLRPL